MVRRKRAMLAGMPQLSRVGGDGRGVGDRELWTELGAQDELRIVNFKDPFTLRATNPLRRFSVEPRFFVAIFRSARGTGHNHVITPVLRLILASRPGEIKRALCRSRSRAHR